MRRTNRFRLALLVVTAVGAGCISTEAPNPDELVYGALQGKVVRGDGSGVGGPLLALTLLSARQGDQVTILAQGQILAGEQGQFVVGFTAQAAPQTGSVAIQVTPPIGSGLLPLDTLGIVINLFRSYPPTDTAFALLTMRPR